MARSSKSRKRNAARSLSEFTLNVAAAGGLLCIVLVALAFTMNMTLIMFKTGSMTPTIPAGSVALVQEIPASDMVIGDVVTVDRPDKLPVTHRVTSIEPAGSDESRTFTMRGDANPIEDADPYTATDVRIVRGHVPELASVIVWFSHPFVLGVITLAASGLVTWAFWPRIENTHETDEGEEHRPSDGKSAAETRNAALIVTLLAAISSVPFTAAEPAQAAETETRIDGTVLRLTSIGDPVLMSNLQPGEPVTWQVGVSAEAPDPGSVDISLFASGDSATAQKLIVAIDSCATRWRAETCALKQHTLVPQQPLEDALTAQAPAGTRHLTTMPASEQRWLRVTVTLDGEVEHGFAETLHVQARGFSDDISTEDEPQTLPETGFNLWAPLLLAVAALTTGIASARTTAWWKRRTS